jgi:hypothetical protein
MFIILEGIMHHKLNAVPILLNPGSVCIIRPDDVHTIGNLSDIDKLHIINIVLRREVFDDTLLFFNNSINFSIEDNSCCVTKTSDIERKMLIEKVELIRKFSEKSDYTPMKILCVKSLIIDFMLMLYQRTMLSYGNAPEWLISKCRKLKTSTEGYPDL